MYQISTIIKLPTEKSSHLHLVFKDELKEDGTRLKEDTLFFFEESSAYGYPPYHLYFITDRSYGEIRIGDWIYDYQNNNFFCLYKDRNYTTAQLLEINLSPSYKKIIATTDSDLNLPRPSNDFLINFCDKGNIEEVLIKLTWSNRVMGVNWTVRENYRPKISSNNTIIIKPVKDSWNRNEVTELCKKALFEKGSWYDEEVEEWIKKNI